MAFALLSTKLYRPPTRAGGVTRPHLVEKLASGIERPGCLIYLSGPAGFGKTTLLSEFAARIDQCASSVCVAWLSLDESDNDPIQFWTYLISACQSVMSEVGSTALALLHTPQPLPDSVIPTQLINDLTSQRQSLVLVLDDYHAIQNSAIHAGILFLIDHLPQNLHIIISTRTDPPWPLARYRARNQLVEIRTQDLRFTHEEAATFLNHTMGLSLSTEALKALGERTEGWIAGLQLAALSLQGRSDVGSFIQAFTGSHIYIAEYLADEVLKQQSTDVQTFLLQTSILDQLNASLCEAVTLCQDGQTILKTLQRANIFIVPLDDEGRWFRYHHLFADLLLARLHNSLSKAAVHELHQRAARWFEGKGMVVEAVEHAFNAVDVPLSVRLVEEAALPMILQAHVRTVDGWLQALPSETIANSPKINMAYAWMNLVRGRLPEAMPFIERLRAFFSQPAAEAWEISQHAEWLAIQAELLISQGRPEESRQLAIQAQKMLPEVDPVIRSMIYVTLAKAYQQTFDYDRAAQVFQMLVQDARRSGDMTTEVLGISGQGQMELKQGHLHRTYEIAQDAIRRLETSGKKVPFSATLYGELGEVFFYWRQFDLARQCQQRSMEISGKSGYSDPEIYFHIMQSKVCQMEGNLEGSVREIEQASHLAGLIPPAMIQENLISQQVRVALASNRQAFAEQLLEAEGFHFGKTCEFPALAPNGAVTLQAGLLYNSALRILTCQAKDHPDSAKLKWGIDLAERVFQGEQKCQQIIAAFETLLLLSQMYAALGDPQKSLAAMAKAVELGEPEGFISPFIEEGEPVAGILSALLSSALFEKTQPAYIRQILDSFPNSSERQGKDVEQPTMSPPLSNSQPLVEPLTARELEVLQLIAAGDSNQMIAEKLVITVSAVKKHTGNIYGKLAVNSRTQAISRARQLGLLLPDD